MHRFIYGDDRLHNNKLNFSRPVTSEMACFADPRWFRSKKGPAQMTLIAAGLAPHR
jgi:hypothetical protein